MIFFSKQISDKINIRCKKMSSDLLFYFFFIVFSNGALKNLCWQHRYHFFSSIDKIAVSFLLFHVIFGWIPLFQLQCSRMPLWKSYSVRFRYIGAEIPIVGCFQSRHWNFDHETLLLEDKAQPLQATSALRRGALIEKQRLYLTALWGAHSSHMP